MTQVVVVDLRVDWIDTPGVTKELGLLQRQFSLSTRGDECPVLSGWGVVSETLESSAEESFGITLLADNLLQLDCSIKRVVGVSVADLNTAQLVVCKVAKEWLFENRGHLIEVAEQYHEPAAKPFVLVFRKHLPEFLVDKAHHS